MITTATTEGTSRETFVAALRSAGLRTTGPRLATLNALELRPHADTDTLIRHVRAELGTVSAQAVYNVLATLVQAELVRRIEPAGSSALYELRVGDNHHHVVCRLCGAVADVDCAVGYRPCLTPSETRGYLLDEAEVTYWGYCPSCQERRTSGGPGDVKVPIDDKQRNNGGEDD
ncbi:MAG: Fur family transcriptional regulator [Nitrospiraceae bacterium]|nr:Fur family transcriptional regulator [Nitrospiraceae bacterium]